MQTGLQAMRLGTVIYFVPFFFVLNPALIGRAPLGEVLLVASSAVVGIMLIAAGLQGYLIGVGSISAVNSKSFLARGLLIVGGLTFAMPGGEIIGYSHLQLLGVASLLSALGVGLAMRLRKVSGMPETSVP